MSRRRLLALLGLALAASPVEAGHGSRAPVTTVQASYVRRLAEVGQPVALVDLRPAAEYARGHLPGAQSVPFPELRRRYGEIPRDRLVILYRDGAPLEAEAAYQFLWDQGHRALAILEEGFAGWRRHGYPVTP